MPVRLYTKLVPRQPRNARASVLRRLPVRDTNGKSLGKIVDFVIEFRKGRLAYAVLQYKGFLGLGVKRFAAPLEALNISDDGRWLILDVLRETVDSAAGIDPTRWPTVREVYENLGLPPPKDALPPDDSSPGG